MPGSPVKSNVEIGLTIQYQAKRHGHRRAQCSCTLRNSTSPRWSFFMGLASASSDRDLAAYPHEVVETMRWNHVGMPFAQLRDLA